MENERLVDDLLNLYHLIRRTSHPVKRAEITPEQYWLMRKLHAHGAQSIGALADALGITGSSVTTACKRLEKAGLVVRQRQLADERMVHVNLTEEGRQRVASWEQQRRELLGSLLAPLAQHELRELQRILEHLLEAAEENTHKEKVHAEHH